MRSYMRAIARAAKNIRNPNDPNIAGIPRQQTVPTIHMGEVVAVDEGRKVLGLRFNDPDGTEVATGIPWMQMYTADNPPAVGDSVRLFYFGNQPLAFGRQDVADDTVTFD